MTYMKRSVNLALVMMMLAAGNEKMFYTGHQHSTPPTPPTPPLNDLPEWEINGHIIHAKDEKTALKYARKRGLLSKGADEIPGI